MHHSTRDVAQDARHARAVRCAGVPLAINVILGFALSSIASHHPEVLSLLSTRPFIIPLSYCISVLQFLSTVSFLADYGKSRKFAVGCDSEFERHSRLAHFGWLELGRHIVTKE